MYEVYNDRAKVLHQKSKNYTIYLNFLNKLSIFLKIL